MSMLTAVLGIVASFTLGGCIVLGITLRFIYKNLAGSLMVTPDPTEGQYVYVSSDIPMSELSERKYVILEVTKQVPHA